LRLALDENQFIDAIPMTLLCSRHDRLNDAAPDFDYQPKISTALALARSLLPLAIDLIHSPAAAHPAATA